MEQGDNEGMALSLLPQPKSVKSLVGNFDFREVDTLYLSKRASPRTRQSAELLVSELKKYHHLDYQTLYSASVTDPRGCLLTHHTRGGVFVKTALQKPQAYELLAAGHTLAISAFDDGGFVNAMRTIRQLLQEGTRIPALRIQDWPTIVFRAIHLDLKGLTPNLATLKEFVERVALHKFSAVLVEYEDRFPYKCAPQARGPQAFTPETLKEFVGEIEQHGLEVIPMLPCLGSLEFVLRHAEFRELAETPEVPRQLCLGNPKAERLIREMLRELLAAHPRARLVHLGPGECGPLGQNPLTKAAAAKLGGAQGLVLNHLTKLIRAVKAAGKSALLAEEALREVAPETLRKLAKDMAAVYGCFEPNGGQFRPELLPHLDRLQKAGMAVYGASAVRGVAPCCSNVPDYRHRFDNVDWWVEAAETQGPLAGLIAMGPSRRSHFQSPCDPLPAVWPAILYCAERAWAGPDSSRESFERRLLVGFYGLRAEMAEVALAHYGLAEEHPREAGVVLSNAKQSARRNRDVLELLEELANLESFTRERQRYTETVAAVLPRLEAGTADPVTVRRLRSRVPGLAQELERLSRELTHALLRRFAKEEVDEFIQDRLLIAQRLLQHLQALLKRHP